MGATSSSAWKMRCFSCNRRVVPTWNASQCGMLTRRARRARRGRKRSESRRKEDEPAQWSDIQKTDRLSVHLPLANLPETCSAMFPFEVFGYSFVTETVSPFHYLK